MNKHLPVNVFNSILNKPIRFEPCFTESGELIGYKSIDTKTLIPKNEKFMGSLNGIWFKDFDELQKRLNRHNKD